VHSAHPENIQPDIHEFHSLVVSSYSNMTEKAYGTNQSPFLNNPNMGHNQALRVGHSDANAGAVLGANSNNVGGMFMRRTRWYVNDDPKSTQPWNSLYGN
jgi:hypothetical protein